MAQVAEAHILTCTFLQTSLKYYIYLTNNDWKLIEQTSDRIHVSMCVSATCTISGTSGTKFSNVRNSAVYNVNA